MTVEETIRHHIHKSHGLKKFIFRVIFKFLEMYIRSIDEVILETRQNNSMEIKKLQNSMEDMESKLEIYGVMLTDGVDLKLKEAMEK